MANTPEVEVQEMANTPEVEVQEMANTPEVEVQNIVEAIKEWGTALIIGYLTGADTTESTEEVRKVVDMVTKVRQTHDEAAKTQGNETVRKIRNDSGSGATLTADELAAKAVAKAAALLG